jgi:hypothetical protein
LSPSKEELQAEVDRITAKARLRQPGRLDAAPAAATESISGAEKIVPAECRELPAEAQEETEEVLEEDEVEIEPEKVEAKDTEECRPPFEVENDDEEGIDELILCKGTKKDGEPCTVQALEDGYCFAHSPALAEKRKEASKKGGANSSKAARLEKLMSPRFAPVSGMLQGVLEELKSNKMDPKTAQAIANVSRVLITVLTMGDLEERVRVLEEKREEFLDVAEESDREFGGEASR